MDCPWISSPSTSFRICPSSQRLAIKPDKISLKFKNFNSEKPKYQMSFTPIFWGELESRITYRVWIWMNFNLPKNLDIETKMKVWKMVFLQVVTWRLRHRGTCWVEFLALHHSLLPNAATKPGLRAGSGLETESERSRLGENISQRLWKSKSFTKKKCTYSKCKYQLLQTVTLLISPTGRSQNFALKRSPKMAWVHLPRSTWQLTSRPGTRPEDPAHQANCNCLRR